MAESIAIAIPAYDEGDHLPQTLADLAAQNDRDFAVWVCVNQPESHATDPAHAAVDRRNRLLVRSLSKACYPFPLEVLSALDPGSAPSERTAGVGWARRHLFATIGAARPRPHIIVSLDADTRVGPEYVAAIRAAFTACPNAVAAAVPVSHPLPAEAEAARTILRYEIYLRYYQLSLWRIGSPYAFLAIGSGMAFRTDALDRIAPGRPRKAGEDFYLMQQLRKTGPVIRHIETVVRPSPRPSTRNPFGTGPVMADRARLARSYPLYAQASFDALGQSVALFPRLYDHIDTALPIDGFLSERLGGRAPFDRMRRNAPDRDRFVRACHERIDGLRTLQWLRYDRKERTPNDADSLVELFDRFGLRIPRPDLDRGPLAACLETRDRLARIEADCRRRFMADWDLEATW